MRKSAIIFIFLLIAFCPLFSHAQYSWIGSPWAEQAHRGGRGLWPENTIIAHKNAIELNSCLELDLQMSKDKKIVVSHDPYLNGLYCRTPEGKNMSKKESQKRLIYDMDYDSIAKYDCGSKPYPAYPDQENIKASRPLLSVLIDSVEVYGKEIDHIPYYDIEIKSNPKWDGIYYPNLPEYVDSVMDVIIRSGIANRTMIQSFDARALRFIHEKWPNVITYYLLGLKKGTLEEYLEELGFIPDYLEVDYPILTEELIASCHKKGIRIMTAVVNDLSSIQKYKDMGVDGIITDYPNLFAELR